MVRRILASTALVLLSVTAAVAGSPDVSQRKDLQIAKDVATAVNRYTQFTIFDDVNANVKNGVVTLTGKVTMPYKRDDLGERIAKVNGVTSVDNELGVFPVSTFDDQLRYRIARAIYGNSMFWSYASMPNPPIHIVVEHSHVTLTGVVQSNVERMLARSLATQFGVLSVTNNLRTDAEVQAALDASQ